MTKRIKNIKKGIKGTNGLIFRATFVKQDGHIRNMIARIGVTKGLKGSDRKAKSEEYLTVFDMEKKAFRTINLDSMLELKMYNQTFVVW